MKKCHSIPLWGALMPYTNFSSNKPMNDFFEIADAPGEIYDIPELQELDDENKFDVNEYLNGNYDY